MGVGYFHFLIQWLPISGKNRSNYYHFLFIIFVGSFYIGLLEGESYFIYLLKNFKKSVSLSI